jgi:hypothetical protein
MSKNMLYMNYLVVRNPSTSFQTNKYNDVMFHLKRFQNLVASQKVFLLHGSALVPSMDLMKTPSILSLNLSPLLSWVFLINK